MFAINANIEILRAMSDPIATYLHDHHAGSRFAIDLLKALRDQYTGTELGRFADELLVEIREDRALLGELVERAGSRAKSVTKEIGAWVGEKATRLKLGSPRDGLGTLQTLETLGLGVQGKLALWDALAELAAVDARFRGVDFDRLADRARAQHARIEEHRLAAARELGRSHAA